MSITLIQPAVLPATPLSELKAYLRIDSADDDALLSALLRAALGQAEDFTGLVLLASGWRENIVATQYVSLTKNPFMGVLAVSLVDMNAIITPISIASILVGLNDHDAGTLALPTAPPATSRLSIDYTAGLATDWNTLAEPLRLGIMRQAVHLYSHRDDPQTGGLALAASALWRPYKRLRLV